MPDRVVGPKTVHNWRRQYRQIADEMGVLRTAIAVAANPQHPFYAAALRIVCDRLYPVPRPQDRSELRLIRVVIEDGRIIGELAPAHARAAGNGAIAALPAPSRTVADTGLDTASASGRAG